MSWWALLPGAAALAALAAVPGVLALRVLGVRGLAALAGGVPVTVAGLGVLSIAYAPLGVPWRLPAVLVGLAALLAAAWALGRLVGRADGATRLTAPSAVPDDGARSAAPPTGLDDVTWRPGPLGTRSAAAVAAAVLAGFLLLAAPFVAALPSPDAPLQQWDGVFHLNALVTVRDTATATPLGGLAPLYGDGTLAPYYPTGWHALMAVAPGLASVPAATNVGILVLGVGVWLVGLAGLAREVFARQALPAVLAPLLAASFVAFPAVQLGVLGQLAHGLSTALLPGALLLVVRAVRAAECRAGWGPVACHAVAAVVAVGGVVVAHASGIFSLAVLAGPVVAGAVLAWAVRRVRGGRRVLGVGAVVALTGVVVAGPVVAANLDALSVVVGFERASGRTHAAALREVLFDQTLTFDYAHDGVWQHLAITAATLAGGVLLLLRRRHRWLVVAFVLAVGLAVLASGPEDHPLRWLAGFWYTQAGRIAPVAVVPAVLLAAVALAALVRWARARSAAGVALAAVLALVAVSVAVRLPLQHGVAASAYAPSELAWGTMATDEELAMMRRAARVLPADAVVVGDPFNGSALLPAVAGVDVVFPQLGPSGMSDAQVVLREGLSDVHDDPAVCAALADVGATHLYQDTALEADGAKRGPPTRAMEDVDVSTGFVEVESAGTAAIYRIEVCD
ncbi:DUF6541 family protein [Georgenia sp. H159]|uniref:DUF6541 family protein n=1 Tax=Georgenia sp. H159 TaxID=3076115 RepID=UPI002D793095|nr:DUF6541 family protein [Georgenia sp. H159]